ncbi:FAD/NAD(P)-binding domain-containing protein [Mycena leptocephala]|nr:FAD/NAD(P)-binding domain-containing protein [Mycena leptocephala]
MAESAPPPLRIFIVGAGLGGLAAAVSLRRQGHRVEIFESSLMNREIGAAITVKANAMRVLEYFGYEQENLRGVDFFGLDETVRFSGLGGEGTTRLFQIPQEAMGRAGWLCHRTDLHDELKRLAIGANGAGPPASLHLGQEVASCDPVAGMLSFKNGEVRQADLIVGADGIHSVVRTSVLGHVQEALSSGISTFRCMFDAAKLEDLADMEWFSEGISGGSFSRSPFQMLFLFPCRGGTLINVVAHHVDDRDQDKHEWSAMATMEEVLDEFKNFHPRYLKFLELADQPILRWQLRALPLLSTWINGRTALLGDAAHATLPTLGQGAGMAIEDAAAIGCLIPLGTRREEIPARLEAYQHLRKSRGEFVNRESLEQATQPSKRGLYARSNEMQTFLIGYDAVGATQTYYREHFGAK